MKTIEQIKNQMPVFLHNWKDYIDVVGDFEDIHITCEYWIENKHRMDEAMKKYADISILFASYGKNNYSGDAWVLFEKDGRLFEVNGSHCSYYGLEGQWYPEPVVLEELKTRIEAGYFGRDYYSDNEFVNELIEFIGLATEKPLNYPPTQGDE